jgi:hypothetical protein
VLVLVLFIWLNLVSEYKAQHKLKARHTVEEAMTEAYVRRCNKCGKGFLKEDGCNKMKCLCGNFQCYVCSLDVVDYSHFQDNSNDGECPLYGNMEERLKEQVAVAQETTLNGLLGFGADLNDADIRVDEDLRMHLPTAITNPTIIRQELMAPQPLFMPAALGLGEHGRLQVQNLRLPPRHLTRSPEVHSCVECHKAFASARSLTQHRQMKLHLNPNHTLNPNRTQCSRCQKSFGSVNARDQHERDKHGQHPALRRKK